MSRRQSGRPGRISQPLCGLHAGKDDVLPAGGGGHRTVGGRELLAPAEGFAYSPGSCRLTLEFDCGWRTGSADRWPRDRSCGGSRKPVAGRARAVRGERHRRTKRRDDRHRGGCVEPDLLPPLRVQGRPGTCVARRPRAGVPSVPARPAIRRAHLGGAAPRLRPDARAGQPDRRADVRRTDGQRHGQATAAAPRHDAELLSVLALGALRVAFESWRTTTDGSLSALESILDDTFNSGTLVLTPTRA